PQLGFDRHGLVAGSLIGADPSRDHQLRVTRRISLQEWWDDVTGGTSIGQPLPKDVDPATTHGTFQTGVDAVGGNLAAVELTNASSILTLRKAGIVADVVPNEGALIQRDIALDLEASTTFTVAQALVGIQPELSVGSLQLALALEQPSGRVVDVVRDLRGNHAASGADLVFQLPALAGALGGHRWQAVLNGLFPSSGFPASGSIASISALIALTRPSAPSPGGPTSAGFSFLEFPVVTAPVTGSVVPASGFAVEFSLPPRALHGSIELLSATTGDTLRWQVIVPADVTQFAFVQLPPEAATPLVAGRTYLLTVSAFAGTGPVTRSQEPYRNTATFLQSIGAIERGVEQVSRRTILVTTN
ncbi:MAG: hypothetical protein ABIP94_03015, partial [Planctomycetota bacterium]